MNKYLYKTRRWVLGREYRHMAKIYPGFKMEKKDDGYTIYWKGKKVSDSLGFEVLRKRELKNIFLVGSGPSLGGVDPYLFTDKATCTLNGSIQFFLDVGIVPTYHVISDESFVENRWELVKKVLEQDELIGFYTPQALSEICKRDASLLNGRKFIVFENHFKNYGEKALDYSDVLNMSLADDRLITSDGKIGFSLDSSLGVFSAHTVMYFALQLMYFIGFRQFFLLGFDLGGSKRRFYEDGASATPSHLDRDYDSAIYPSFEVVSRLVEQGVFQVYNCTPESRLPSSLIQKAPLKKCL